MIDPTVVAAAIGAGAVVFVELLRVTRDRHLRERGRRRTRRDDAPRRDGEEAADAKGPFWL